MTCVGECAIRRLDDGQLSVLRADNVIDASVELLEGELDPQCSFDGETFTINAVEGVVKYKSIGRHATDWGHLFYRMERVA